MGFFCRRALAPLMLMWLAMVTLSSAQVTFSRDWNPGKRGGAELPADCSTTAKSAATVCHMLLDELRQLVACESRTMMRVLQAEDTETNPVPIYTGRR